MEEAEDAGAEGGATTIPADKARVEHKPGTIKMAFIRRPWITAIERRWRAAITARVADAGVDELASEDRSQPRNLSRFPRGKIRIHAFSPSWMTYFSKPRFRRLRAN